MLARGISRYVILWWKCQYSWYQVI